MGCIQNQRFLLPFYSKYQFLFIKTTARTTVWTHSSLTCFLVIYLFILSFQWEWLGRSDWRSTEVRFTFTARRGSQMLYITAIRWNDYGSIRIRLDLSLQWNNHPPGLIRSYWPPLAWWVLDIHAQGCFDDPSVESACAKERRSTVTEDRVR